MSGSGGAMEYAYHLPNYVLAALMYTLVGRFLLALFVAPDSRNYIMRAFVRLTDPVLAVTGVVTPRVVPLMLALIFAVFWLFLARVILTIVFVHNGWIGVS